MQSVVIDTNIVLDMWLFDDPRSRPLNDALQNQGLRWLASAEMTQQRQSSEHWARANS
jgi:predicted nucleic acid-binding protein